MCVYMCVCVCVYERGVIPVCRYMCVGTCYVLRQLVKCYLHMYCVLSATACYMPGRSPVGGGRAMNNVCIFIYIYTCINMHTLQSLVMA
jgi:hypothetical protein